MRNLSTCYWRATRQNLNENCRQTEDFYEIKTWGSRQVFTRPLHVETTVKCYDLGFYRDGGEERFGPCFLQSICYIRKGPAVTHHHPLQAVSILQRGFKWTFRGWEMLLLNPHNKVKQLILFDLMCCNSNQLSFGYMQLHQVITLGRTCSFFSLVFSLD